LIRKFFFAAVLFPCLSADAQILTKFLPTKNSIDQHNFSEHDVLIAKRKLYQRNSGVIFGLQRGKFNAIELGGEAHWRKISLLKPHIIGATANMEYNISNNVIGYKAGLWMKRGRINLTYGANAIYSTDFNERNSFGIGPAIGFRFFGFHLINGYNFLIKEDMQEAVAPLPVNELYMSLRYYFPVENKFTWDRKTMKKKKARKKERMKKKEQRLKANKKKQPGANKKWNIFKKDSGK
jgi:hypothetical protein